MSGKPEEVIVKSRDLKFDETLRKGGPVKYEGNIGHEGRWGRVPCR